MSEITVSVRNLVEFILRHGDINSAAVSSSDMALGTRIHRKLQKQEQEISDYTPEVRLFHVFNIDGISVKVQGIADGIIRHGGGVTVDEIKSTSYPLELITEDFSYLHQAQADFYAFFICKNEMLDNISTRLTYCSVDTEQIRRIERERTAAELESFALSVVKKYAKWIDLKQKHDIKRNISIDKMPFPFDSFRQGQREAAGHIYKTVKDQTTLFVQAPTGIGKTISALFPTVKAMGEGHCEKLFYLTAKTTTAKAAENALMLMQKKGLYMKSVSITSKEKICEYQKQCTPEKCPFAKGHFDRINDAVFDLISNEEIIGKETVLEYSKKHNVCPFELTLDASDWCDAIIGDFNYAFDPRASLKRYFEQGGKYAVLCDEAHNLVERGREMFSAELSKREIFDAQKELKDVRFSEKKELLRRIKRLNGILLDYRKMLAENETEDLVIRKPEELYDAVFTFCDKFSAYLAEKKDGNKERLFGEEDVKTDENNALTLYFNCLAFLSVFENAAEEYVYFVSNDSADTRVKLFCVDPSRLISEVCDKCGSVVFFSATLLPKDYYMKMLGGKNLLESEPKFIRLPSPFPRKNLMISIFSDISTRYADREKSLDRTVEIINVSTKKKGNYIAFFPSFAYMKAALERFGEKYPDVCTLEQRREMTEDERAEFLDKFTADPKETMVAFAV
ncbi:MAG: ATP-dependent DNA helicase, partial [Ruminococcaceae bacterium]|nr:ATP-dependent DNA helicase [Oscillospiraceae bacterium]